jgi:hypothetical protein
VTASNEELAKQASKIAQSGAGLSRRPGRTVAIGLMIGRVYLDPGDSCPAAITLRAAARSSPAGAATAARATSRFAISTTAAWQ